MSSAILKCLHNVHSVFKVSSHIGFIIRGEN